MNDSNEKIIHDIEDAEMKDRVTVDEQIFESISNTVETICNEEIHERSKRPNHKAYSLLQEVSDKNLCYPVPLWTHLS